MEMEAPASATEYTRRMVVYMDLHADAHVLNLVHRWPERLIRCRFY